MPTLHLVSQSSGADSPAHLRAALMMVGNQGASVAWMGRDPAFGLQEHPGLLRPRAPLGNPWFAPRETLASFRGIPEPRAVFSWDLSMLHFARRAWPRAHHRWMQLTPPRVSLMRWVKAMRPSNATPFKLEIPEQWLDSPAIAIWKKTLEVMAMSDHWLNTSMGAGLQDPAPHITLCGLGADAWIAMDAMIRAEAGAQRRETGTLTHRLHVAPGQAGLRRARMHAERQGRADPICVDSEWTGPTRLNEACKSLLALQMPGGPDAAQTLAILVHQASPIPIIAHDTPALRALTSKSTRTHLVNISDARRMAAVMMETLGLTPYRETHQPH